MNDSAIRSHFRGWGSRAQRRSGSAELAPKSGGHLGITTKIGAISALRGAERGARGRQGRRPGSAGLATTFGGTRRFAPKIWVISARREPAGGP